MCKKGILFTPISEKLTDKDGCVELNFATEFDNLEKMGYKRYRTLLSVIASKDEISEEELSKYIEEEKAQIRKAAENYSKEVDKKIIEEMTKNIKKVKK